MTLSKIFIKIGVRDIGRQLDGSDLSPLLKIGTIAALLRHSGIIPDSRDCINNIWSGTANSIAHFFSRKKPEFHLDLN